MRLRQPLPGTLDGQRSFGAVHLLFVHTPYRQSEALRHDEPTAPVRLADDVAFKHFVL